MVSDNDLRVLIKSCRGKGAIVRTKVDSNGCIVGVSIGKVPGGRYRKMGDPGAEWIPPVRAAELLREVLI